MAGQTPRFGFNFFGGDTDGTLADDDGKFTGEDRLLLDTILSALEKHNHRVPSALQAPTAIPSATYVRGGGALEGDTTYFYVISFVDADGLETVTGPEIDVEMPASLPTPDDPQGDTSTGSGTLSAGIYYYALTGLRTGEESALGTVTTVTVLDDENTVTFALPDLGDATSYQLWRQSEDAQWWTRVGTGTTTIVDDGSVPAAVYGDPANLPPTTNSGVDDYQVVITLTGADATTVQDTGGWRIYRTTVSGTYSAASLVAEVIERLDDLDPTSDLETTYVDTGDAPLVGSPQLISSQLMIPAFTFEQADPLPPAAGYPQNYPILDASGALYINRSGTWTVISGSGSGGSGGQQFKGAWDQDVSETPGYDAGDVVIDAERLWQAITPVVDEHPSDTAVPGTAWASITSTSTYVGGISTQYAQGILASGAQTLAAIDVWNLAASALPFDVQVWDSDPATGTMLASATVTNPAALPVGWINVALDVPVTIANPSTHVITAYASGNGVFDNVGATTAETETGPISTFTGLSYGAGYTSSSSTRYLAMRLYSSVALAPWTKLGRFIPEGSSAVFAGDGPPSPEPAGAAAGDLYFDIVSGNVYRLTGI